MLLRSVLLSLGIAASCSVLAQNKLKVEPLPAPAQAASAPQQQGGIQGQNIFDVKPEVKPDASSDPKYPQQSNGERNRVQPGNNAPMWRGVQAGVEGYSSLPKSEAPEAGILIQAPVQYPGTRMTTAGEAWRQIRNHWIIPYGAALLAITMLAVVIFWFARGPIGQHPTIGGGGRLIERFTPFERAAHQTNALAFVVLGISGIIMAFGKFFLLPVLGVTLFGYLTYVLKTLHNFFGPLFAVSLLIAIITFIKDELPMRGDLKWLMGAHALLDKNSHHEPPSHRFNFGEKILFWVAMVFLGALVVASGLVLDKVVPNIEYLRVTMQQANIVHGVASFLMMCLMIGHIYLGTVGMKGAYGGMRHGYVDEAWAKEHHAFWYEDVMSGKIPAQRSAQHMVVDDAETPRTA